MPLVRFLPAEIGIEVAADTLIHDAAVRAGLLTLDLPCGGQGTCGECMVEIARADGGSREVMACQTCISGTTGFFRPPGLAGRPYLHRARALATFWHP